MTWLMNLSKLILGILGEASDVKGHSCAGTGGVAWAWRSSVHGGPDREDFRDDWDDAEKSLTMLFFFLSGFRVGDWPLVCITCSPESPLPNDIVLSVARGFHEQTLTLGTVRPSAKLTVTLLGSQEWRRRFGHSGFSSISQWFDDACPKRKAIVYLDKISSTPSS